MSKTAIVENVVVSVGDVVGFKSDIEQSGRIVAIDGRILTLENPNGFDGAYIGGDTRTTVDADRCWVD
jgi:hypothetical protein